jgi:hypothetical protein
MTGSVVNRYPGVFLTDNLSVGFLCGTCVRNPVCYRRWVAGHVSTWKALVKAPKKTRFTFAGGVFGEPGANKTRGPAWVLYVVFPGPKLPKTATKFAAELGGAKPFVDPPYKNPWGAMVVEVMLFGDQLKGGQHTLSVADGDGTVIFRKTVTLVARQP